jgi:hypothetical protein
LFRAAGIGAALFVGLLAYRTGGLDSDVITALSEENTEWAYGMSPDFPTDALTTGVAAGALGACWGAGCELSLRLIPAPKLLVGAAYGVASWAGAETLYRCTPSRQQPWMLSPPSKHIRHFTSLGVVAAALIGRGERRG